MGKVHNLQPLPLGLWGIKIFSKTKLIDFFYYSEQDDCLKILIRWLYEKMIMGGGLVAIVFFFGHSKKALEL